MILPMKYYTGIGSRETPAEVQDVMTIIANVLSMEGWILRSGAADGADSAFEKGSIEREIWLPSLGFNQHVSRFLPNDASIEMASLLHPAWHNCKPYAKLLHARNCNQVLGKDLGTPSKFLICWTKGGKAVGGTATALKLAQTLDIPILNLGQFTENYIQEFEKFYKNMDT